MNSTTLASVISAFRDVTDLVINKDNIQYDVYPGNFTKHLGKTKEDKYLKRRLRIWRSYETDKPKDEVLDNRLTQVSDAVNRIKSLMLGKMARKDVAFQHRKQYHFEMSYKRVEDKLLREKQTQDKLSKLEDENAKLKEEIQNLRTTSYTSTIKSHVDDTQHTRQIHYLRTRRKLISDNSKSIHFRMPTVSTQTESSMLTQSGYLGWLKANRDTADGTPLVRDISPKDRIAKQRRDAYLNSYEMRNEVDREPIHDYKRLEDQNPGGRYTPG